MADGTAVVEFGSTEGYRQFYADVFSRAMSKPLPSDAIRLPGKLPMVAAVCRERSLIAAERGQDTFGMGGGAVGAMFGVTGATGLEWLNQLVEHGILKVATRGNCWRGSHSYSYTGAAE